ncbi:MAG TPA: hypothetical protein PLP17_11620, partial [Oligoflexia bacterium]|nr:hypothetical protein [Oligoflexia bacterium]
MFSFVTNQAGFDTRIVIENTTKDALNTSQQTGTCTIRYYGSAAPASQLSSSVPAGDSIEFTLSSGGTKNIAATPGFQGYIIADCTFPLARGYSFLSDMGGTTFLAAEPAEVLMAPRGNIARPLLFSFVSNQAGLDTGIAIANTSLDGLGSTPQNGTCTIRYFGTMAGGGPVPAPQTSSSIQAGNQLVFTISSGGTHGIMAAPGFQGYITATCTFPHARGYSFLSDLGVMKFGSAQHAEVLTLPRGTTPKPLLFRFATNQAGFDTAIAISNTSNDGLGTAASSGTCSIRYYGHTAAGGPAPSTQTSAAIPAGKQLVFSLSNGGSYGIAATPGFQGYIIASCSFAHARGQSLVSDLGMLKLVASETAEVINTPRDQIPRPLLFSYVSNQSGWDTGIAIANTSLDPVGSTPQSGTCTLRYYGVTAGGLPAPAAQTSTAIPAGETLVFTLSSGGSYGISAAVGFKGYIMAHCNFPLARGYSFISDIGAMNYAT